jgi:tyrosine ammonia-lyase
MTPTTDLTLGPDHTLTPALAWRAASRPTSIALDERARSLMLASQRALDALIAQDAPIYGVTTGFGPLVHTRISPQDATELQTNLVYHLATGLGPNLDPLTTRITLLARANALAQGFSGVAPSIVELLISCLLHDILPPIPSLGSVGASGDLTPLAHLALMLMGHGSTLDGRPASQALAHAQLAPLTMTSREALALVNGTSVTASIAATNNERAHRALHLATHLAIAYAEITRAQAQAWHPIFGRARPHPGLLAILQHLQHLTHDSARFTPHQTHWLPDAPPLQDPYTARCVPQLFGSILEALWRHEDTTTIELNSATDNPLINPQHDTKDAPGLQEVQKIFHGGNFYGQHLASASDALSQSLILLAIWAERVIARLCDERRSDGLPPFLQAHRPGLHAGLMGAQVTASALVAALRADLHPAAAQSIPTNADNQDINPLGTLAAWRTQRAMPRLFEVLAICAATLSQAIDLREGPDAYCHASRYLYQQTRAHIASLGPDRPLSQELHAAASRWHDDDTWALPPIPRPRQ